MIIHEFINNQVKLDAAQLKIAIELRNTANQLNQQHHLQVRAISWLDTIRNLIKFCSIDSTTDQPTGLYIYGGVGRGKTMLMKSFFEYLNIPKEILHFQYFMQQIHEKLYPLQQYRRSDIMRQLANDIAKTSRILCLDEFEIRDISDAMLIMELFKYLISRKIIIVLTTNSAPDSLYQGGIQRETFLPFIHVIKEKFNILCLDGQQDYRMVDRLVSNRRIFYPLGLQTSATITKIKKHISANQEIHPQTLKVFGRDILFQNTHQQVLFTDFTELLERDMGYIDYVTICRTFCIIVVENLRKILENETDIITRLINFIDNAYFYKISLFITAEVPPAQLYLIGHKIDEFNRTISRLNEMNQSEY